ncbi:MAG: hypothetical protein AB7R89_07945 [Dehalococcoidia bacterium]
MNRIGGDFAVVDTGPLFASSVIILAERFNTDLIITHDHRHIRAVRPHHAEAFRLLPADA